MDRKKIIIIGALIVAAIILLVLVIWLAFFRQGGTFFGGGGQANTNTNVQLPLSERIKNLPPPSAEELASEANYPLGVKQTAVAFAERYGSFSNETAAKNLDDLKGMMTIKMQSSADKEISQIQAPTAYEGYEARVFENDLVYSKDNEVVVLLKVQRAHYTNKTTEPEVYYQNLQLKLVKAGEEWKVDEAKWQ